MLFIRPALRSGPNRATIGPGRALVDETFAQVWATCEQNGPPTSWQQMPAAWREDQERLLNEYDRTAPYRGKAGRLPPDMQLWPANQHQIAQGAWPPYQLGAYPFCFRLAADPPANTMGQAPGTHWYHAHKHESTALNVANGMTGVFVIEGWYDDDLRRFYGQGFRDQVLMIQQLSSTPFPLLNPLTTGPNFQGPNSVAKPQLSVNGRLNPVVKMRPGEVQLWRVVNGAFRDAVQFQGFAPQGGLAWRQIAQDGVQFAYANYNTPDSVNRMVNLAPADLLVKAPVQPGRYTLTAQPNEGLVLDPSSGLKLGPTITLLTVSVEGPAVSPAQDFIQNEAGFPSFPAYLADIPEKDINLRREVDFGAVHNLIDGKTFNTNVYSQVMKLNSAEEWKISNEANDKSHPFHIHVNPFQITEVFQPNLENSTGPGKPCYVDPLNPQTWKPCTPPTGPFAWWDTFAIPTSAQIDITKVCSVVDKCPAPIQKHTSCSKGKCTVTIPGYFKMRSRFVDFTGTYVLHCHILIHEDRGMMQLVEVVTDKPPYMHK